MRVVLTVETRFERTPDGRVWGRGWLDASFWSRYLDVFDRVLVLARVLPVAVAPPDAKQADGPGADFADLPYYIGPWQYLARRGQLCRAIQAAIARDDAVILRAPGTISSLAHREIAAQKRPYAVEVIGDPLDVFSTGGVRSVLSPVLRRRVPRDLRRQCRGACAVSYVTQGTLQRRYPPGAPSFVTAYSSIDLGEEAFAAGPRVSFRPDGPLRTLLVGSLEQLYKGPDVLLRALAHCKAAGLDVRTTLIGDGRKRPSLEALAGELGLADRVHFTGRLPPGSAIRDQMDRADVFVLPSLTEGLPRAMLEAMARGLPCIGSRVGGIPELLPDEDLVDPGDSAALADKLISVAADADRLREMAARNLLKARQYHADVLRPRRRDLYAHLRAATENWLRIQA